MPRKAADIREKELKLAIYRIERGRGVTGATALSIAAVAREAGVSSALIHNYYPKIAEIVRTKVGGSSQQKRDQKHAELKAEKLKSKSLRAEKAILIQQIAQLASINETLLLKNRTIQVLLDGDRVRAIPPKR